MFRTREYLSIALALIAVIFPSARHPRTAFADTPSCTVARAGIAAASEIRGLETKTKVPCFLHSRDKIREFILSTIDEKVPPQRIRMEEVVFKAIGFIPEDFDYKKGLVDLYVSQIGGYYDPERNQYIMADWMPDILQTTVAVHELTHALQDQYYDLDKFIDMDLGNSDELLARSALVEGDATAVMHDYTRRLAGLPALEQEKSIDGILLQNVMSLGFAGGDTIPESLRLYLLFPYTSGLRFAHTLLMKGGYKALDAAFLTPPRSTEEILHPEKYGKHDFEAPKKDEVGRDECGEGMELVYTDTLGEFAVSILLGAGKGNRSEAVEAAKGWGGDSAVVREKKGEALRCVAWETRWDTDEDGDQFWKGFLSVLRKRFGEGQDRPESVIFHGKKEVRLQRLPSRKILFLVKAPM